MKRPRRNHSPAFKAKVALGAPIRSGPPISRNRHRRAAGHRGLKNRNVGSPAKRGGIVVSMERL